MKVLFLDIDGVVNSYETEVKFHGFLGIDPKLALLIKDIVDRTNCEIVLSSTWRLDRPFRQEVRRKVGKFMAVTPDIPGAPRGDEVASWLDGAIDVERYAIVDDQIDFHDWQPVFRTKMSTGITREIADEIIKHLNGEA